MTVTPSTRLRGFALPVGNSSAAAGETASERTPSRTARAGMTAVS